MVTIKKVVKFLTDKLFFDTDCISAFLWADNENILAKLFPNRIIIPKEVYDELSYPNLNHIKAMKAQIDLLVKSKQATIGTIEVSSDAYRLYDKLTNNPDSGHKIIGKGEAACISLAYIHGGIIASNNLKDISSYIKEYNLVNLTTGDILKMALDAKYITEDQGNQIWLNMLSKRRKLGYKSFTEYLLSRKQYKI